MKYYYFINLDERGEFFADVRDENDVTIYEIEGFDLVQDGFMRNTGDVQGLEDHLKALHFIRENDTIERGN